MFKLLAMQVRGVMDRLFMGHSLSMEQQLLLNAKPLPASTTQESQAAAPKPHQPVSKSPKRKLKVAQPTSVVKSRKAAPKPAQTTLGNRGQLSKTLAPQIQSPAPTKRKSKQEAVSSTTVAAKLGKKKPTARQVAMVSQSKPIGSKSKTPAQKTRQHAK
jgi:hypothetical protein